MKDFPLLPALSQIVNPHTDSGVTENLTLRNIPYGGKLYRIDTRGGKVTTIPE